MTSSDIEIVLLRPDEVIVDKEHFVQRDFKIAHAKAIAADYEPGLFGIGYVSLRADAKYYVMDGQHRCAAAIMAHRGQDRVPFYVIRGLTVEEEARKFEELNRHKLKVDALSQFKVGLEGKNPINLEIVGILNAFGLTIGATKTEGSVSAVATLLQIFHGRVGTKSNGAPKEKSKASALLPRSHLLTRTLQVLTKAWGRDGNAFDGTLMKGVAAFIYKHDVKIQGDRLSMVLSRKDSPTRAIGKIRALKEAARVTATMAAVQYFEGVYNLKLSDEKKLQ